MSKCTAIACADVEVTSMHRTIVRILISFWTLVGVFACAGAIALALTGCVPMPMPSQSPDSSIDGAFPASPQLSATDGKLPVFHATLKIQADGQEYQGTASLKRKSIGRTIRWQVPNSTYLFSIVTCAGALEMPRPKAGWYDWSFTPVYGLENLGSCLAIATAITDQGEIYKGLVDFNEGDDLPATVVCNREKLKLNGAGICQSKAQHGKPGLVQVLEFDTPTVFAAQPGCAEPRKAGWIGSTNYEIDISPGLCVYKFRDSRRRTFRLTTYGYTEIKHVVPGVPR